MPEQLEQLVWSDDDHIPEDLYREFGRDQDGNSDVRRQKCRQEHMQLSTKDRFRPMRDSTALV
jgi:hypothetical protein